MSIFRFDKELKQDYNKFIPTTNNQPKETHMNISFNTNEPTDKNELSALIALLNVLNGTDHAAPEVNVVGSRTGRTILTSEPPKSIVNTGGEELLVSPMPKEAHIAAHNAVAEAFPELKLPLASEELPVPLVPPVTLDKAGTPWDERIHSSSHKVKADGIWTRRRNVPEATFQQVMAELTASPTVGTVEVLTSIGVVAAAPAPPVPIVVPDNFPEMMQFIAATGLSTDQLEPICKSVGLDSLLLLGSNLEMFPALHAAILLRTA